jgi:hypothetical protein
MIPIFIAKIGIFFAAAGDACNLPVHYFFFLPSWWEYLNGQVNTGGVCEIDFAFPGDIWLVGLAILDILLRIAGFVAVVSIIIAGAQLITSEGNAEKATSARNRLMNALIGLAIAVIAAAVVTFVGKSLGG